MNQQEQDGQAKFQWVSPKLMMILPASAEAESPKLIIHVWRTLYSACDLNTGSHLQLVRLLYFKFRTLLKWGEVQVWTYGSEILLQDRPYIGCAALTPIKV